MICIYWPSLRADLPPLRPWQYPGSCFSALSCPEIQKKTLQLQDKVHMPIILRERAERATLRSEPERWRLRALDKLGSTEPKIKSPLKLNPSFGKELCLGVSIIKIQNKCFFAHFKDPYLLAPGLGAVSRQLLQSCDQLSEVFRLKLLITKEYFNKN